MGELGLLAVIRARVPFLQRAPDASMPNNGAEGRPLTVVIVREICSCEICAP
jgi:hypothetical protein